MPDTAPSTQLTLTKTRIRAGVWEGMLMADGLGNYQPRLEVVHLLSAPFSDWCRATRPAAGFWPLICYRSAPRAG